MTPSCDLKKTKPIRCEEVELNPGDMIVFRGDFIHAGSGYDADNYRIHYYCDSKFVPRKTNQTWLISDSGNVELRRIIQPRALVKEPSVRTPGREMRGESKPVISFLMRQYALIIENH